MSTTLQTRHQCPFGETTRGGFALPAALAVLVLLSVLVGTVFANAMASFRSGTTDLGKARTHFAAEGGAEAAMSQLADALQDGVLTAAELSGITPPTIPPFTYDSFSADTIGGTFAEQITDGPFTGLYSLTQIVDVYAEASDPDGNSSAVVITAKAQAIPIFQFGVFYEKDLEVDNLPPMTFAGWVHANGSIWTGPSGPANYEDLITTPNKYYRDAKAWHLDPGSRVKIDDATSTPVTVTFDSRTEPVANDFRAESNADFDDRLKTDAYGVDSLSVPLPTGVDPLEIILPRDVADGTLERAAKFAWKADWYIEIDLGQIDDGDEDVDLCDGGIAHTRDGGQGEPTESECNNIFSFEYDMWYEARERRFADVLDIDVRELQDWAVGADSTAIVYIDIVTPGYDDPEGDNVFPIVGLVNGSTLDYPLTISTRHPLYTLGDYNSGVWQPGVGGRCGDLALERLERLGSGPP